MGQGLFGLRVLFVKHFSMYREFLFTPSILWYYLIRFSIHAMSNRLKSLIHSVYAYLIALLRILLCA